MTRRNNNILVVANYPPNPGYAWWLMERCWLRRFTLRFPQPLYGVNP